MEGRCLGETQAGVPSCCAPLFPQGTRRRHTGAWKNKQVNWVVGAVEARDRVVMRVYRVLCCLLVIGF